MIDFKPGQLKEEYVPYDLLTVLALRQQDKSDQAAQHLEAMKKRADDPGVKWAVGYATNRDNPAPTDPGQLDIFESLRQLLRATEENVE